MARRSAGWSGLSRTGAPAQPKDLQVLAMTRKNVRRSRGRAFHVKLFLEAWIASQISTLIDADLPQKPRRGMQKRRKKLPFDGCFGASMIDSIK